MLLMDQLLNIYSISTRGYYVLPYSYLVFLPLRPALKSPSSSPPVSSLLNFPFPLVNLGHNYPRQPPCLLLFLNSYKKIKED